MQTRLSILNLNMIDRKKIVLDADRDLGIELINFYLSYQLMPESDFHFFYSFASNPARYIESLLARALKLEIHGNFLVINSFIKFNSNLYLEVITAVETLDHEDVAVIASSNDVPLGYFFGRSIFQKKIAQKLFLLRFLCVVSANLDFTYLRMVFELKTSIRLNVIIASFDSSFNFFEKNLPPLYSLTTMHALVAYQKQSELPACRIAVMPSHAGDILFFLKAFTGIAHPFNTILVHQEFVPIVQRITPDLQMIVIEEDSIERGLNTDPSFKNYEREEFFFRKVLYPSIPINAIFYWFRHSVLHSHSKSHMIDQWKFSLTDENFSIVSHEKREKKQQKLTTNKSVLLHLDAGWPLKVYPKHLQEKLIKSLENKGYRVSVLTNQSFSYTCSIIAFENIEKLEKDILAHAIFVGMDSFPVHFSTHILQHPSICLFSLTRPENSNASVFDGYQFMQSHLKCCPCEATAICPKFRYNYCKNFSSPESILEAIDQMWHRYHH